ncbi:hypothetical protein RchiOBHm_Chr5g0065981 [Rosa chinensis]|uniref:Uncharacterized protein n=1 Tax=Rosa chinensis TaxID=74649 RepID=A0A2P6QJ27_ROSCH|nr:hypothetical protein RchiOBHm_Chr5g0065981 [Rosa chinensis]
MWPRFISSESTIDVYQSPGDKKMLEGLTNLATYQEVDSHDSGMIIRPYMWYIYSLFCFIITTMLFSEQLAVKNS